MRSACGHLAAQEKAGGKGMVPVAVAAVRTMRAGYAPVAEEAVRALANLAILDANCSAAVAAGALVAVVQTMNYYMTYPGVVEQCCRALRTMTVRSAEAKGDAVAAGAIPTLLAALVTHKRAQGVTVR